MSRKTARARYLHGLLAIAIGLVVSVGLTRGQP